ncbi:toxin-antitoxin system HicB family antitoxin [Nonomuraea sediminis]|uniref:toxin-antitoxin system HicB family antitoxin n=1 Tax=Nonomuraea sediminis TaxID=2835864 RepID=UPI001BDBDD07|nr:toxin-antitoxin system HicB family antitoxin [Nonomuraea sediminis]
MDLTPYVDSLRRELAVAAAAGGEEARALAERLVSPLESATRLALLEALSAAAEEITRELAPGSVDVRLRGRDPDFVVTPPPSTPSYDEAATTAPPPPPPPADADEGGTSRITLRVPDHLKPRIEEAAAREGISVNSWLVRAVSAALEQGGGSRRAGRRESSDIGRRYTGWVR